MIINFVGNFQTGYVGEQADQVHLAREMEALGHIVRRVPQDIWREYVLGSNEASWQDKLPIQADINIITKWDKFYDGRFIHELQTLSKAPVFYWCWDYMYDNGFPEWHEENVITSDLYLGNDVRCGKYTFTKNTYYFPFDVADGDLPQFQNKEKIYNVVFFGSCIPQGDRIAWLTEINKTHPVKIFSWNWQEWKDKGFDAEPAIYGIEFNKKVAESKIVLGFSVNPDTWGYWSNRVGKVLLAGGFLLYQYAPGMELFLRDGMEYFSSIEEANEKINYYLNNELEREQVASRGHHIAMDRFTSRARVEDLVILAHRFIKTKGKGWMI